MDRTSPARRLWGRLSLSLGLVVLVVLVGFGIGAQRKRNPGVVKVRVVAEYPHDPKAFTQGLVIAGGQLYEGTGKEGESTLRRVELATGRVERSQSLDPIYFGEGITVFDDRIYQITWKNRTAFVYDLKTMQFLRTHRYADQGWGLTHNGEHLILSDGSSVLRFLDPNSFEVVRRVRVRGPQGPIDKLNELEFVKGELLANIWYSDRIARISPETGELLGWLDLSGLYTDRLRRGREDVLNGIAYDAEADRLFVTGKNWPRLYEIAIPDS